MMEDKFVHLKHRLSGIHTLAMLKMEKNFIAEEKNYPRQPYLNKEWSFQFWIDRAWEELQELQQACDQHSVLGMQEECADLSNIVDYLFEKLAQKRTEE